MPLRVTPPGEDSVDVDRGTPLAATAGGFKEPGFPAHGEDHVTHGQPAAPTYKTDRDLINAAERAGLPEAAATSDSGYVHEGRIDFLQLTRQAEQQALLYVNQVNRAHWHRAYRAFHNQHWTSSKYQRSEWRDRSKNFPPKTRSNVFKDMAAVAASLFNNADAITCMAGNDADPRQRGAAAVMQELINYRTDRTSGKNAIPWYLVSLGSRQDAVITGVCCSKQSWLIEYRTSHETRVETDEAGNEQSVHTIVHTIDKDRPECQLIPPENYVIASDADWRNPAQSAQFLILKFPMSLDAIQTKQNDPFKPWLPVPEETLKGAPESGKYDTAAIRRSREEGLDRLDETQTGSREFKTVWVYEVFMRIHGDDWTFLSVGDQAYLTEPAPVREVYPEFDGERPVVIGYGSLESHRIFPMAPVTSWQEVQVELNDLRNLGLDALKQSIFPVTKIVRGRQVDVEQVKRRSYGSAIMVNQPTDVSWEHIPDLPQSLPIMQRSLELEFDDLAGATNPDTIANNNALGRTLGGLKLAAGAASSVQEFNIRLWLATWTEPVLSQIVKLEQYYESDPVVLGLVGQKAKLFQKHGIDAIDDDLLNEQVTVRVSVGVGAGDPMARLEKFQAAAQTVAPFLQQSPDFQQGKVEINWQAIVEEVFGAVGYKDAGDRFFKPGQGRPDPLGDLPQQRLQAQIQKDIATGKAATMTGLAALAKVSLGNRELEADNANALMDAHLRAMDMGHEHGARIRDSALDAHDTGVRNTLSAIDHGHRHGMAIVQHQAAERAARHRESMAQQQAQQKAQQGSPIRDAAAEEGS